MRITTVNNAIAVPAAATSNRCRPTMKLRTAVYEASDGRSLRLGGGTACAQRLLGLERRSNDDYVNEHTISECNQPATSTQPPTLCETGNEYRAKCGDALRLESKSRMV